MIISRVIYKGIGVNLCNCGDPVPTTIDVKARYDRLRDAFGAQNYYVTMSVHTPAPAYTEAIASTLPTPDAVPRTVIDV